MPRVARAARIALAIASITAASSTARAQGADTSIGFQSPSGNIHCIVDAPRGGVHVAACELRDYAGEKPPRPKGCDLDWVPGATLNTRGRVSMFSCQGDTLQDPRHRKLGYGETLRHGEISCLSESTGMTCRTAAGRGFTVSRGAIRTF